MLWNQTRKTDSQTVLDHITDKALDQPLPPQQAKVNLAPQESRLIDTPEGKFIALEDGSVDLGQIDEKIAEATGKPAGAIRLACLLYTSPSPRDLSTSRMPSSA